MSYKNTCLDWIVERSNLKLAYLYLYIYICILYIYESDVELGCLHYFRPALILQPFRGNMSWFRLKLELFRLSDHCEVKHKVLCATLTIMITLDGFQAPHMGKTLSSHSLQKRIYKDYKDQD